MARPAGAGRWAPWGVGGRGYGCRMRYGVLGPLEVRAADGERVPVPGTKVRALLALLLAAEGRTVHDDTLTEALWGASLPADPANSLQTKVSQLRRALDRGTPGAGAQLVRRAPGYALRSGPVSGSGDGSGDGSGSRSASVDVDAFRALTARAREARAREARGAAERAALYGEALALWRGAAYEGVAEEVAVRASAARLEEERLAALEEWAAARLDLGQHVVLAGELADLVARYPLRERLRALQLRALYRAGRQGEALTAYEEARALLAGELGADPGPELAGLHRAILKQDPELDAAPLPRARPVTNLPAPVSGLVGREAEVAAVREQLGAGRLVTLTGPGGVGKTRLALEAAGGLLATSGFPDGVWLVELAALAGSRSGARRTDVGEEEVAAAVLAVLGVRDETGQAPRARLTDVVRERRALLVLDNCEGVVEGAAVLADALLRAAPGLRLLVTSQEPLAVAGERVTLVRPLPERDALRLFTARAAAAGQDATLDATQERAARAVCRRLDGIPLALELAATRVRALGVRELAARLDDRFRVLDGGLRALPARQRTLRAAIDWSWELLEPPEQAVLRRLAVHADGCTLRAAEEVCAGDGVAAAEVLGALTRLVDRSLVVPSPAYARPGDGPAAPHGPAGPHGEHEPNGSLGPGGGHEPGEHRYQLLESIAAYGVERLAEAGESARARDRHARHHTALAVTAAPLLRGPAQREWLARLDAESANLRAALDHTLASGDRAGAVRLVAAQTWYWFLRGRTGEARGALRAALACAGPGPRGDAETALAARSAGFALLAGEGASGGDPASAVREAAGAAGAAYEDAAVRTDATLFLAVCAWCAGELALSEELTARALADRPGPWGEAVGLALRARQALLRGELESAARDGARCRERFGALGDRWGELQALESLSVLAEIAGEYGEASALVREGLRGAEELGLWPEVTEWLTGLGRLEMLAGSYERAAELHERARVLAVRQGHTTGEVHAEIGLALTARRAGDLDTAERGLRRMLEWHRRADFAPGTALVLAELGFAAEQRGEGARALALHTEGLAVARRVGDPRGVALAYEGLAGAYALRGELAGATRLLGEAEAARRSVGAPLPPAERFDTDRVRARLAGG